MRRKHTFVQTLLGNMTDILLLFTSPILPASSPNKLVERGKRFRAFWSAGLLNGSSCRRRYYSTAIGRVRLSV